MLSNQDVRLKPYLSRTGAWAYSLGTSIGWGSLVITSSTYLSHAGPLGSVLGMIIGTVIMLIISRSYHYMMKRYPDAGGAYAYTKNAFGFDYGFLTAWFLALTYFSVLWANATSLPLFARYFIGDVFRFVKLYTVFGYEIYLGEILLSVAEVTIISLLCIFSRRLAAWLMIAAAGIFMIGILLCAFSALFGLDFGIAPAFNPDVTTLGATLIYGFVAAAAYKTAKDSGDRRERIIGLAGTVIMILFGLYLLLPNLFAESSLEKESYFFFVIWSVLGLIVFRIVLKRDKSARFGHTLIVWVALLSLTLFVALVWMNQSMMDATADAMSHVQDYYLGVYGVATDTAVIAREYEGIRTTNGVVLSVIVGLLVLSVSLLINNYSVMSRRARKSEAELGVVKTVAFTDSLTGVKSKHAYVEQEHQLNRSVENGSAGQFAMVVCDVNGLKFINDTQGHAAGDCYLCDAAKVICDIFKHSPVYRIGGDEFVVILHDHDYEHRDELYAQLRRRSEGVNLGEGVIIACGLSTFDPAADRGVASVFECADALMYENKKAFKGARR